jgi:arginine/lysine/histidine transporter system substrate-binding protein
MKKLKILICIFCVAALLVGCGNSQKTDTDSKKILIMGTSACYPPFEFIKNRQIIGFDIDLANTFAP